MESYGPGSRLLLALGTGGSKVTLALQNMRYLHSRRPRKAWRFVLLATLTLSVVSLVGLSIHLSRVDSTAWSSQRARILADLNQGGERHLVIVRYSSEHNSEQEWVNNAADIDGANVVWAREMDAAEDLKLLMYFNDRRVWLLEADLETPKLIPYPGQALDSAASKDQAIFR